jgi:hypothetical protein
MFPNIEGTRSQIMNKMQYIYTIIFHKWQSSIVICSLHSRKNYDKFSYNDVQSNKIEHNVNIKENTHNSIYIDIYNKQIQYVPIIPCFSCELRKIT